MVEIIWEVGRGFRFYNKDGTPFDLSKPFDDIVLIESNCKEKTRANVNKGTAVRMLCGLRVYCDENCVSIFTDMDFHYNWWMFLPAAYPKFYDYETNRILNYDPIIKDIFALSRLWKQIGSIRKKRKYLPPITGSNCCEILKSHAESLKDDPDRLSTDFIKRLSKCECK